MRSFFTGELGYSAEVLHNTDLQCAECQSSGTPAGPTGESGGEQHRSRQVSHLCHNIYMTNKIDIQF